MSNKGDLKNRLKQFIKANGLKINAFEKSINVSNGYINSISKGIGADVSLKIIREYPKINLDWLLTGNGEMFISDSIIDSVANSADVLQVNEPQESYGNKNLDTSNKKIPFYDIEAIAGDNYSADMTAITEPNSFIDIGDMLKDSEKAMRVYNNSMTPNYPPGCIVGFKRVYDSFIEPGNVYVIETRDNRYIKRLYNHENPELIECYSDNITKFTDGPRKGKYFYESFPIPKNEIISLHRVVGVIKRNINQ